jgi:hypothetical protein
MALGTALLFFWVITLFGLYLSASVLSGDFCDTFVPTVPYVGREQVQGLCFEALIMTT